MVLDKCFRCSKAGYPCLSVLKVMGVLTDLSDPKIPVAREIKFI